MAAMMEAYFDESGTHHTSPVMAVAGYLLRPDACLRLQYDWQECLRSYGLPYFRMSECANGAGAFSKIPMDQRISIERRLIETIKLRTEVGFACSVIVEEFNKLTHESFRKSFGSAYTMCCNWCIHEVGQWAERSGYNGKIAYFFESGHDEQNETNRILARIAIHPELKDAYRYASHTFAEKRLVVPLQAADILAWQWHSAAKRLLKDPEAIARKDLKNLLSHNHMVHHFNEASLHRTFQSSIESNKRWGLQYGPQFGGRID
jgi:hypothetical protein